MRRERLAFGTAALICVFATGTARAQSVHYAPSIYNIRDFAIPGPGFYGGVYNYWYLANQLHDASGQAVKSVTVTGPGARLSTTINVNVNISAYALAPRLSGYRKRRSLGLTTESCSRRPSQT